MRSNPAHSLADQAAIQFFELSKADESCFLYLISEKDAQQMTVAGSPLDKFLTSLSGMGWATPQTTPADMHEVSSETVMWAITEKGRAELKYFLMIISVRARKEEMSQRSFHIMAGYYLKVFSYLVVGISIIHAALFFLAKFGHRELAVKFAEFGIYFVVFVSIASWFFASRQWRGNGANYDVINAISYVEFLSERRKEIAVVSTIMVITLHLITAGLTVVYMPNTSELKIGGLLMQVIILSLLIMLCAHYILPRIFAAAHERCFTPSERQRRAYKARTQS